MGTPKTTCLTSYIYDGSALAWAVKSRTYIYVLALALGACAAPAPPRPTFETGVKPVDVPTVIPAPCIDAKDVPEQYVASFPANGDVGQNASAAAADLRWLVPRYDAARAKLIKCAQETK